MSVIERRDGRGIMRRFDSDDPRLGRIYEEDPRDEDYPIAAAVPRVGVGTGEGKTWNYHWPSGWWGNQEQTPHCVGFAWIHWAEDGPRTRRPFPFGGGPVEEPSEVYRQAQQIDRWPGESYSGTSVRAGAKVLQNHGMIDEYRWAFSPDEVRRALLTTGPLVVGSWWWTGMTEPDEDGFVSVSGGKRGGHAYVVNGINLDRGFVRAKNSWGRSWGDRGFFRIRLDDFWELLHDEGEACLAIPKGGR